MRNTLKKYLEKIPEEQQNTASIAYLAALDHVTKAHPKVGQAIIQELYDQRSYLKLIASENYSSLAVQLAMGNLLTDKYAEGYPFRRFYAGCDNIDLIEHEAQEELKKIFDCERITSSDSSESQSAAEKSKTFYLKFAIKLKTAYA